MNSRELIGKITIQENISPIERNKIKNTFVIHIPNPLASYYSRFTEVNRPNSIVFVTKNPVSFEKILRATDAINTEKNINISGAKCEVILGRKKHSGIRVKGIDRYTNIENIQNEFKKHDFDYAKSIRLNKGTDSIVRINKFFNLVKIEEGLYQSPNNKDRYYIEIPKDVSWEKFRDLTFDIKNNVSVTNYDIAKGIFYENEGITDVLRVVKPNVTLNMIKEIQQKYLDRLS